MCSAFCPNIASGSVTRRKIERHSLFCLQIMRYAFEHLKTLLCLSSFFCSLQSEASRRTPLKPLVWTALTDFPSLYVWQDFLVVNFITMKDVDSTSGNETILRRYYHKSELRDTQDIVMISHISISSCDWKCHWKSWEFTVKRLP